MMKKIINFILLAFAGAVLFANEKTGERSPVRSASETKPRVVASTSWTAAFADIAGADGVETVSYTHLTLPTNSRV